MQCLRLRKIKNLIKKLLKKIENIKKIVKPKRMGQAMKGAQAVKQDPAAQKNFEKAMENFATPQPQVDD